MTAKSLVGLSTTLLIASAASLGTLSGAPARGDEKVDYPTQVRPILEAYCYECHGPEVEEPDAGLRLDRRETAFVDLGGYDNIVPGDPDDSELYLRVDAEFEEDRMPPYEAGTELTDEQIETIRLWIQQGAEWVDD